MRWRCIRRASRAGAKAAAGHFSQSWLDKCSYFVLFPFKVQLSRARKMLRDGNSSARCTGRIVSLRGVLRLIVLVVAFLRVTAVVAGDYTVSYAFDGTTEQDVAAGIASPLNEAATSKDCVYDTQCRIKLDKSDLVLTVVVTRAKRNNVSIWADRRRMDSSCCYFSGGERHVSWELNDDLLRLRLYEGHARKRNEYVQNLSLGVLYVQFSDLR